MESIPIRVIIEPILSLQYSVEFPIFEEELRMTITIGSNTLIKDICGVIMKKIGLEHIARYSEAYIQPPYSTNFVKTSRFNELPVSVGMLEEIVGDTSVFKVVAHGTVADFSGIGHRNTICRNLVNFFIKKYPSIKEDIDNPVIKNIIEHIENHTITKISHHTLYEVNKTIEREINLLGDDEQSISTLNSPKTNNNHKEIISIKESATSNIDRESQVHSISSSILTNFNKDESTSSYLPSFYDQFKTLNEEISSSTPSINQDTFQSEIIKDGQEDVTDLENFRSRYKNPTLEELVDHSNNFNAFLGHSNDNE